MLGVKGKVESTIVETSRVERTQSKVAIDVLKN
jgi:hypothetical protein